MSSSSSPSGGELSVNITESWRIQVGALEVDDIASAGVVLRDGDLILAGSCGPSGSVPDGAFSSHIRSTGASGVGGGGDGGGGGGGGGSNFTAYRLDGTTGEPIWQYEGTTGFTTGDFLFAAGLAGGGGGGQGDDAAAGSVGSSASGGQEFVVLGGSTEGNWNNASSSLGMTGGGGGVIKNNAQIAAVKLDAATGEEIWRFQQVLEGDGGSGGSASGSASSYSSSSVAEKGGGSGGRGGVTGTVLGVAGDPEGNIFLVGFVVGRLTSSSGSSSDRDFFVMKLDSATGGVIWRLQDGTPSEDDVFFAAATDSTGSVVAAGYTLGDYNTGGDGTGGGGGGGYDFIAAKFGRDGEELWRYQSGTEKNETFRAVTVDGDDNVYLGGESQTLISETAHTSPVVHKLDGDTGQLLWTYDEETSTNSTFRSLVVDGETGLVVCAGVTDGDWAQRRQSGGFGQGDFAVAFLEYATGEQFGRWHSGSDADDALTFAGVSADGSVTLAGYTRGDLNGNLATTVAAAAETEGADFAVVKLPPLDRKTLAPGNPSTPAPTSKGTNFDADFLLGPTVEPTRAGLRATPGPTEASDATGAGGAAAAGGEGSGEESWVVPATVLGAIVGIFLLCE